MMNELMKETIILILDYVSEKEENNQQNIKEINEIKEEIIKIKESVSTISENQENMWNKIPLIPKTKNKPKQPMSKFQTTEYRKNNLDAEYEFDKTPRSPGYELIDYKYIKQKRGKWKHNPMQITIDQIHHIKYKIIKDASVFTNGLFYKCSDYLKSCGLNQGSFPVWLYHILAGHFDDVLDEYELYLRRTINPTFEQFGNCLRVNGVNTKLNMKIIDDIVTNIPLEVATIEDYTLEMIDKYPMCPSECMRTIIDNSDHISLLGLLRREESVPMLKYGMKD